MKYLQILAFLFFTACGQTSNNFDKDKVTNSDSSYRTTENITNQDFKLTDKKIKFLWRADKYDSTLKKTFYSIFINEDFCKTITNQERAALGYVATFIGNECGWDGDYKDDRRNLKCKILTALNLGYQCSDKHLGFLRQMFKNDIKVLEELKSGNCPTTPDGATIQDTFDEISLTVAGNEISVSFKASGINTREGDSWSWTETDHFQLDKDNIKLIKKDESKVKHEHFEMGE